jgi:hypothetical protein
LKRENYKNPHEGSPSSSSTGGTRVAGLVQKKSALMLKLLSIAGTA